MSFSIKTTAKTSGRPDLTQARPSQQSMISTDDHRRQITGPIFGKVEMVQNRPSFLPFYVNEGMRNVVFVQEVMNLKGFRLPSPADDLQHTREVGQRFQPLPSLDKNVDNLLRQGREIGQGPPE